MDRETLRWGGWGACARQRALSVDEERWIRDVLGIGGSAPWPAPSLASLQLPGTRLSAAALKDLEAQLPQGAVTRNPRERAFHALGQSYHDLLRYRSGALRFAPDAVAYPGSPDDIARILSWAGAQGVAVVPFGGGTSVVGGVSARSPDTRPVITIDLARMDGVIAIDLVNLLATFEAGIYGPALERALAGAHLTLGHYPQSFEHSTLGGWIAARGAGQQSNRYGTAATWLASATLVTPTGFWKTEAHPASAAGPCLTDLVAGSEGTLGIIASATVHVHPAPEERHERAFLWQDFDSALDACRRLSQNGIRLSMLRLSDSDETFFQSRFSSLGRSPGLAEKLFKQYVRARGFSDRPLLMLLGSEGPAQHVKQAMGEARALIRRAGGLDLGRSPAEAWRHSRFDAPYLRDPLLELGIGVDTLETAACWSALPALYKATRDALQASLGQHGLVMGHVSHTYTDGASLYFTYVFPIDRADPLGQWQRVKQAASEAIVGAGGTISHHHGVGEDHLPWMTREKSPLALAAMAKLRKSLDPAGIINPGKLLPFQEDRGSRGAR